MKRLLLKVCGPRRVFVQQKVALRLINTYRILINEGIKFFSIYRIFSKRKKKLVRGSNPHLSFNRPLRAAPF